MKKFTTLKNLLCLMALTLVFGSLQAQEATQNKVTLTLDETTASTFTYTFTVNSDSVAAYYIFAGTQSEIDQYESMFGVSIEEIIATPVMWSPWGIRCPGDTTYTWTQMTPNTEYVVYAVSVDASGAVIYPSDTAMVTPMPDASITGVSNLSIAFSEITENSVRMVVTPDSNTVSFFDGIVETQLFDSIGFDSVVSIIKGQPQTYMLFETDDWTWNDLDPNTKYTGVAVGQNGVGEWGNVDTLSFTTLQATSVAEVEGDKANGIVIYPTVNDGQFSVSLAGRQEGMVTITDVRGAVVYSQEVAASNFEVSLNNVSSGVYFLIYQREGTVETQQFVVK